MDSSQVIYFEQQLFLEDPTGSTWTDQAAGDPNAKLTSLSVQARKQEYSFWRCLVRRVDGLNGLSLYQGSSC
jgi:hypothetical protein